MRILALADVLGHADLLTRLAREPTIRSVDAILCVGNLLSGGPRVDEWQRARAEGRSPRRRLAEIEQQERSDVHALQAIVAAFAAFEAPVMFVPGSLDAPERLILGAAANFENTTPNLACIHRSLALIPYGPRSYAIAGFGGRVTACRRETELVLEYPSWEAKAYLSSLRNLDQQRILLVHTPPRLGKPGDQVGNSVGSEVIEEMIHTLNPQLVVCGNPGGARAVLDIEKSFVVSPGSLCQGSYAVVDLEKWEVRFDDLPGVTPDQDSLDRVLRQKVERTLAA